MHLTYPHSAKFTLFTLFIFSNCVHGYSKNNVIESPLLTQKIGTNRTIVVDANGEGDFKSIQDAIDHVPNGNSKWIIIHITKGVYREKVRIPRNKPYIFLRGNGRGKTSIVWSQSSPNNYESATFKVEAPHFLAFGISFKNLAPRGITNSAKNDKAVAALVGADKAAFYHCAFFSNHNTLFDYKGRHYYDNCYIQGSIDFIFGHGQAMFHDCEVFVIGDPRAEIQGSITAHYRQRHNENSGFVFVKGKVYGIGDVYLGRAKGAHSRVVFANTYLSNTIIPHGWSNWSYPGSTRNLYHGEYNCHGPGSGSKDRAHWSKQLSDEEAAPFVSINFVRGKEWLPAW
ncbi:Pectinesterase [Handroanthus impetiginosus]|uniref:Pectinesterase n=1 Tax=Handroanthus impetiginosus TaxID=429701 RepID=A0A2G9HNX2_9LAMI|nr:Pectinesterase [Handroanthus impetiginosus]